MRIKVECALRFAHQSMIDVCTNCDNPKYTYLGIDPKSPISMLFDVETNLPVNEVCEFTKKICKNTELGKTAIIRVISE